MQCSAAVLRATGVHVLRTNSSTNLVLLATDKLPRQLMHGSRGVVESVHGSAEMTSPVYFLNLGHLFLGDGGS